MADISGVSIPLFPSNGGIFSIASVLIDLSGCPLIVFGFENLLRANCFLCGLRGTMPAKQGFKTDTCCIDLHQFIPPPLSREGGAAGRCVFSNESKYLYPQMA